MDTPEVQPPTPIETMPAAPAIIAAAPPARRATGLIVTVVVLGIALLAGSAAFGLFTLKAHDLSDRVKALQASHDQNARSVNGAIHSKAELQSEIDLRLGSIANIKAATQSCLDAMQAYINAFVAGANQTNNQAGADAASAAAFKAGQAACAPANVTLTQLTLASN